MYMDWYGHTIVISGVIVAATFGMYIIHQKYCDKMTCCRNSKKTIQPHINNLISKDKPIVVDKFDVNDVTDSDKVMCRCWLSKNFPYCDGSHRQHNKNTGDNVGPLVLTHTIE